MAVTTLVFFVYMNERVYEYLGKEEEKLKKGGNSNHTWNIVSFEEALRQYKKKMDKKV